MMFMKEKEKTPKKFTSLEVQINSLKLYWKSNGKYVIRENLDMGQFFDYVSTV